MFKKCFTLLVMILVMFFLASGVSFAVDLGDDIKTGMSIEEVKEKFELDHFKTDKGMTSYKKVDTGTYYFFNKENKKLLYKLVVMADKKWDEIESMLEKKCGDPVVRKDKKGNKVYFFADGDTGFKMSKNDMFDDAWQLWYGSISLWDDLAEDQGMNKFPE
ncbi:MAG: hypothetical protein ACOC90_09830 [Bacteroidota bacterium]